MTPAPRTMPSQPYLPGPSCGGMNGVQLSALMYTMPKAMNSSTTVTLMNTATLLNDADSLMPTISSMVIRPTMTIAGTLSTCPVADHPSVNRRQMLSPASAAWCGRTGPRCTLQGC